MRPGRSGGAQIDVGGGIAEGFHAVAALDQALARADQGFELDGFDLAAVLFTLKALLCLLVIVEFGLDPLDSAVEGVDGGPEDLVEVEIEAGVGHGGNQGVEDVGDCALDDVIFGCDPGIGLVFGGAVAVEFEFFDGMAGRGRAVIGFEIVVRVHGMLPSVGPRPSRPSWRDTPTGAPVWQREPLARALMAKPG